MSFRWIPEPCTCNTDVPCTAKVLREHFKNTYFACGPVEVGPDLEAIEQYLSKLTDREVEVVQPPARVEKCHQWRKYGTKYGKNNIQREYYKCRLCDMRKRVQLKNNIEIDCNVGHKK